MKITLSALFCCLLFMTCAKEETRTSTDYNCRTELTTDDILSPARSAAIRELLTDVTSSGIPGMQVSITDSDGTWSEANGLSDIHNRVDMLACHRTRVGSTVKIFTAVTCLLLQEEGLLNLDDGIAGYLPASELRGFENADRITIRHLLQHSSGLPNYITSAQFQTASLNDLEKTWTREELLAYARNKPADFAPGSDVSYSNTGYILLGDIISAAAGMPFYEVFADRIFVPLGLHHTQFAATDPVPADLVRGYVDLYSRTELINATNYSGWDYFTADGGLISNAHDLSRFTQALFSGALLPPTALSEMLTWQTPSFTDPEGFPTDYGLGIFRIPTEFGDAYVHGGDAIGYFAFTAYFPEQETAVSWAVNGNYGTLDELVQGKAGTEAIFRKVFAE